MIAAQHDFRVHFADGRKIDVRAATPTGAEVAAKRQHPGIVTKIKVVKETSE